MNRLENWFCSSGFWRYITQRRLLPWILERCDLGEHLLEIGAGPGAATNELRRRVARVTSLEYDRDLVASLAKRTHGGLGAWLQGDAATLPFPEKTFSAAIAVLVLHHLPSSEQQDKALSEVYRVLRPGGVFLALEIEDGWLQRVSHIRSTFVPVAASSLERRLGAFGFSQVALDFRGAAFRLCARRPADR